MEFEKATSSCATVREIAPLASNAAEATDDDSSIRIQVRHPSQGIAIEIEDQGKGMPSELIGRLERGEPFTTKPNGNGLGVSSAVLWAKENGYGLRFQSEPGQGTRVCVELPR